MTILEQRFLETAPSKLQSIDTELKTLNNNLSKLTTALEEATKMSPETTSGLLHDSLLSDTNICDSESAAELLRENLQNLDHEELWILLLNHSLQPIKKVRLCVGTLTSTLTDYRRLATEALDVMATSVIVYHNHPSGNVRPSSEDIRATEKMKSCLDCFDIALTDHIIIGAKGFYSFADEKSQKFKSI